MLFDWYSNSRSRPFSSNEWWARRSVAKNITPTMATDMSTMNTKWRVRSSMCSFPWNSKKTNKLPISMLQCMRINGNVWFYWQRIVMLTWPATSPKIRPNYGQYSIHYCIATNTSPVPSKSTLHQRPAQHSPRIITRFLGREMTPWIGCKTKLQFEVRCKRMANCHLPVAYWAHEHGSPWTTHRYYRWR